MSKLLVVDDEPNVLYSLQKGLQSETVTVITAETGHAGIEQVRSQRPDAVVLDVRLPDMSGLEALAHIRQIDSQIPVIVVTAFATTETAIEAMKRGAFEYLLKPVALKQLREVVQRALDLSRLRHVPAAFGKDPETPGGERIVGQSAAMQEVYKTIGRVAPQDVSVLILGESGTGKELVARALYQHSQRQSTPFLALNCAALPETLLESELFGHERGAFTGADHLRIGKFEQANHGTLFLDELGDMTLATQAKVLRILQDGTFERVGGNHTLKTNVRIIAATNQQLESMVEKGQFRRDLFFRLNDVIIRLPSLRERMEDLPLLVEYFVRMYNVSLHKDVQSVAPEAMRLLETHVWPGNVRELQGVIKSALIQGTGPVLTREMMPSTFWTPTIESATESPASLDVKALVGELIRAGEQEIYWKVMAEVDRVILGEVLAAVQGSQVQASEVLGISRTTLRHKLASLGLTVSKQVLTDSAQPVQNLHNAPRDRRDE